MKKRMLSPTSVNMYNRCPRKFYLRYIRKLPTKPSIHLIRGRIVHDVLRDFQRSVQGNAGEEDTQQLREKILAMLESHWQENEARIADLDIPDAENYLVESRKMVLNYLKSFIQKKAWTKPKPETELKLFSQKHFALGIIDLVENGAKPVIITDFKTSRAMRIEDDLRRQLAIYALLYKDKFGAPPDYVGVNFLAFEHGRRLFKVSQKVLDYAKREIEMVREQTQSDDEQDYPCTCGGFCERDFAVEVNGTH